MFPRNQTAVIRNIKNKLFCKRAGIEPTIGHLKSDYRLGNNFYKGMTGDTVNVLLAAAVYNFKRAMKAIWCMLQNLRDTVSEQYLAKMFFKGTTSY